MTNRVGFFSGLHVAGGGGTITVASYANVTMTTTTSPKTLSTTWNTGDILVCFGTTENCDTTLGTPTVTGLTFTVRASITTGAGSQCPAYIWSTGVAGSGDTQNVSITRGGTAQQWGYAVWVITGGPSGTGNSFANQNESTTSLTCTANSIVCYGYGDWSANATNQTAATGSGTSTERLDGVSGSAYAYGAYDWVGVSSGANNYGLASYSGLTIAQAAVEILD